MKVCLHEWRSPAPSGACEVRWQGLPSAPIVIASVATLQQFCARPVGHEPPHRSPTGVEA